MKAKVQRTEQNDTRNLNRAPDLSSTTHTTRTAVRAGFTLIELTVVILILGVLAAIVVPKLFDQSATAAEDGLRQTLKVMRDAIDMYTVNNSAAWPGASDGSQATFKSDLTPYLRGPFPVGLVGPVTGNDRVRMRSDGVPLSGKANPGRAWRYDYTTGEFIYNYNGISSDGVTRYDEF